MTVANEMLQGAIDMHLHCGPDTMPCIDPIEAAKQARQAGMRAIVLKNHHYTTAPLAQIRPAGPRNRGLWRGMSGL